MTRRGQCFCGQKQVTNSSNLHVLQSSQTHGENSTKETLGKARKNHKNNQENLPKNLHVTEKIKQKRKLPGSQRRAKVKIIPNKTNNYLYLVWPQKQDQQKEAPEELNKTETPKEALKTEKEEDDIEIDQKDPSQSR